MTCFFREAHGSFWRRVDTVVEEQCYSIEEIGAAVREADFAEVEMYTAEEAGVTDGLGFGRLYVRAWT